MRLNLNPNPEQSGGGNAPPPPAQQQAAPTPPPMVPLTVEEYQRLRSLEGNFNALQSTVQAERDRLEGERIKALADKGQVEQAMAELAKQKDAQLQAEREARLAIEGQYHGEKKSSVMAAALMGVPFVSEVAAAQVKGLLESQFETRRDASGAILVVDKVTGLPAAEVIKQQLASPAFAHFLKASTQGGSGGGGSQPVQHQVTNGENPFAGMDLSKPYGVYARRN